MTTDEKLDRLIDLLTARALDQIARGTNGELAALRKHVDDEDAKIRVVLAKASDALTKASDTVAKLADTIAVHDAQIEALITAEQESKRRWDDLQKQWQAYLNTLPKQ